MNGASTIHVVSDDEPPAYKPQQGSIGWLVYNYFVENPDEELTGDDIVIKFSHQVRGYRPPRSAYDVRHALRHLCEAHVLWYIRISDTYMMGIRLQLDLEDKKRAKK